MKATAQFLTVHPVLAVRDVLVSIGFYVESLGFKAIFADDTENPKYAGVRRGNVELHLQWHDASQWQQGIDRPMLRFHVVNTEALFEEYQPKKVFHAATKLRKTEWNTREFAFYDPDGNGLTFYEYL